MTMLFFAAAAAAAAGFAVRCGVLRTLIAVNRRLAEQLHVSEARHDAYRLADTRYELDDPTIGPVTGGTGPVLFDQDREPER